jgi:hypothetical protein
MATNYPTTLDTFTEPPSTDPLSNGHYTHHVNLGDAVQAIEGELGLLPKGSYASVLARLNDSAQLTGTQTIGGAKTFSSIITGSAGLSITGTGVFSSTISASGLAGSLLSATSGAALGTAGAGTSAIPARADHIHPTTGLVLTTGTQTIAGAKTFSSQIIASAGIAVTGALTVGGVAAVTTDDTRLATGEDAKILTLMGVI